MVDPFELERFVKAQAGSYEAALAEIRHGTKLGHWMWYIFPQFEGLGSSPMAQLYAIRSLDEARAYLDHPVLGPRYYECVDALQNLAGVTAEAVFGVVDAMKLRSSLTLFAEAGGAPLCEVALKRWFGSPDEATLRLLHRQRH